MEDDDFENLLNEVDREALKKLDVDEEGESFPMVTTLDAQIIMHRDVHFGGKFEFMIDYYAKGGKGINPEFEMENIEKLYQIELEGYDDIGQLLLTDSEEERINAAKDAYQELRSLYEEDSKTPLPRLIADLILSEEEEPEEELKKIVAYQKEAIPLLIDLLRSDDFRDPLFPGYGDAPRLAARCLGMIGDEKGIVALFESIKAQDFIEEEEILSALYQVGEPAKKFLMRIIASRPITQDNIIAAVALAHFSAEPDVSSFCLAQLQDEAVMRHEELALYMVWGCEGLTDSKERSRLLSFAERENISKSLKEEILFITKAWK